MMLPLWKFNPAREGEIVPTADYPRKHFATFRHQEPKPTYISTVCEVDEEFENRVSGRRANDLGGYRTRHIFFLSVLGTVESVKTEGSPITCVHASDVEAAVDLLIGNLPKFVM
jgi:hypothetical protein